MLQKPDFRLSPFRVWQTIELTAALAAVLLLALTACGKARSQAGQTGQQTVPEITGEETVPVNREEPHDDEPWKEALAEDLFQKYGVLPEYYEDLGDGFYLVYVDVGGEILPFVTVDSATGDYHG